MGAVYEARNISGVRPFEAANHNLVVVKILTEAAWPLRDVAPHVPASLAAVIDRALAMDRAERWPDVSAMLDALIRSRIPDDTTPLATRHALVGGALGARGGGGALRGGDRCRSVR